MLRIVNRNDCWSFIHGMANVVTDVKIHARRLHSNLICPVGVLNAIHDYINGLNPTNCSTAELSKAAWSGEIDALVEAKGCVVIEPTDNTTLTYTFEEIEKFFDDKPALYVKDEKECPIPAVKKYAIEFHQRLTQEVDSIGQMVSPDFDSSKEHSRSLWLVIAYAALGKAQTIDEGRFDMGDEDDALAPVWSAELRVIANIILHEFQSGDGKV